MSPDPEPSQLPRVFCLYVFQTCIDFSLHSIFFHLQGTDIKESLEYSFLLPNKPDKECHVCSVFTYKLLDSLLSNLMVQIQISYYFNNQACHRVPKAEGVSQNNQGFQKLIIKPDVEAGI